MKSAARRWRLEDLSVGFAGHAIVEHLDLTITSGDLLAITGANGAGKSCLLRTLAGELLPVSGSIRAPDGFAADSMGVVPQVTDLDPRLPITLGEMAALGLAGIRGAFVKEQLSEALASVDLSARAQQAWRFSSGGERQRALIARALIRRPQVLLLDEATSHLDPASAENLFQRLGERCSDGRLTVVAVVHDRQLANRHATRQLHLADGRAQLEEGA